MFLGNPLKFSEGAWELVTRLSLATSPLLGHIYALEKYSNTAYDYER